MADETKFNPTDVTILQTSALAEDVIAKGSTNGRLMLNQGDETIVLTPKGERNLLLLCLLRTGMKYSDALSLARSFPEVK